MKTTSYKAPEKMPPVRNSYQSFTELFPQFSITYSCISRRSQKMRLPRFSVYRSISTFSRLQQQFLVMQMIIDEASYQTMDVDQSCDIVTSCTRQIVGCQEKREHSCQFNYMNIINLRTARKRNNRWLSLVIVSSDSYKTANIYQLRKQR